MAWGRVGVMGYTCGSGGGEGAAEESLATALATTFPGGVRERFGSSARASRDALGGVTGGSRSAKGMADDGASRTWTPSMGAAAAGASASGMSEGTLFPVGIPPDVKDKLPTPPALCERASAIGRGTALAVGGS